MLLHLKVFSNLHLGHLMALKIKNKIKTRGKIYTPKDIVKKILDLIDYSGTKIVGKKIIDNSCGDGRFLQEITRRYCIECKKLNLSNSQIKHLLETNIYGIEVEKEEIIKCKNNLNCILKDFNLTISVEWNIICENTLKVSKIKGTMDYVVGNPPYVRIHNINDTKLIKDFKFAQKGMTDLYLPFFEVGIEMLNDNGILGYITPNSYFNSKAAQTMREYFCNNKLLTKIIDFKHKQLFDATTYTAITILHKNNTDEKIQYFAFDNISNSIKFVDELYYNEFLIEKSFYFANRSSLSFLHKIKENEVVNSKFLVKNGYATLADKVFIGNFSFSNYCIPIVKASTGKIYNCIFPYVNGWLVNEEDLKKYKDVYCYLKKNYEYLKNRSLEKNANWYSFGRSQGINDTYKDKYSINNLVKDKKDIKLIKCSKGVGVYSGLYIVTEIVESILRELIVSDKFIKYISLLGKYKSGGYYTFSSKDLKDFLEYMYTERFGRRYG